MDLTSDGSGKPRAEVRASLRYNWDDIIFFLEVARTRNLVRAGQKLKVDHTTVSRRVRELERSLNTTLFKRSKAGFALTEAGLRLLQFAEGMENNANAIVETVVGAGNRRCRRCGPDREHGRHRQHVPDALHRRLQQGLSVDPGRTHHRYAASGHDPPEADIFVSFFKPKGRRLSVKKIGEFKISLYASSSYLQQHPDADDLKDLDDHGFIDFIDEHIHIKENRWLSDILRPAHVVFQSTSLVSQFVAVSGGLGIAMLPSYVAAHNKDLRPVLPNYFSVRDIWLSAHEDLLHIRRIKAVISFLEKRVAADREFLLSAKTAAN